MIRLYRFLSYLLVPIFIFPTGHIYILSYVIGLGLVFLKP